VCLVPLCVDSHLVRSCFRRKQDVQSGDRCGHARLHN
jgi:hypothetical protein